MSLSERILILAPVGRDASLAAETLCRAGIVASVCADADDLQSCLAEGAGAILFTEEAFSPRLLRSLEESLAAQAAWSDLPIVILVQGERREVGTLGSAGSFGSLRNVTLLERPMRPVTLVSIMQAAIRARKRQYELRDLLAQLESARARLETVVQELPIGVAIVEAPDGKVVLTNAEAQRHFGGMTEAAGDSSLHIRIRRADGKPYNVSDYPPLRALGGETVRGEEMLYGDPDDVHTFLVSSAPIRDKTSTIVASVSTFADITERKRIEEERRRFELEHALSDGIATVRQRVAQELHDSLIQQLVGIRMLAASLHKKLQAQDHPEATLMQEFGAIVADATVQVRKLIDGLVPKRISAENLVSALERAAHNIKGWYNIPCHVHYPATLSLRHDDSAHHLFYVAQEAMTNAAKHAGGSCIHVSLTEDADRLVLEVTDNGSGLRDDYDRRGGMGFNNMRYRAELIGATLTVMNEDEGGTRVRCTLVE